MALALKDRVKETTTTTGTGTVTLAGAASGFQSFAAVGDGNQTFYAIVDSASGDWEVGVGTYTSSGTTLSRTTVVSSSNAGSLVNFGAGSKDVFVTYPSSRSVYLDAAGSAVTTLDIGTLGTSTANITTANITSGTVSTTPTSGNDITNKTYVDTLAASGIHFHQPVMVESPTNLNATYNNGTAGVGATLTNAGTQVELIIDGIFTSPGDRVLVYSQTNPIENGIYVVTVVGTVSTNWVLTRASDANTYVINSANGLSEGSTVFVQLGATGAGETYTCNTSGVITFGTTNITFAQISSAQIYSAGTGLSLSGTTFSITNTGTAGTYGSASSVPVITTNAQGQVTGVTPTAIAISGAAVSGNISGQAGSVANALTAGTYLTAAGTYDGSAARTFAVDATDANTASKVVARDASGNFSAGTITATLSGSATSATTATNLAGGAANRIAYQTSAGITNFIAAPSASNQVLNWNGSAFTWSAGTISGVALGSNLNTLTFGTYLTGTSYNGSSAVTIATNATNANTASTLVARDASGNFSAGTITAALNGNASTATTASNVNNGTLTMNVSGTGLSGSQTFTANQAGNATFTVTSNATAANTGSTIVARDAGGSFSAGTITATLSGNATTATTATTANRATRANGNFYIDDNFGNTVVGVYSASRYQGVFAMGDAYKLPADGTTTGNLYGIAWSYPGGQGGASANLNTHGALLLENGAFLAALSGSIRCRDDMRSPIFYDLNNTGYYLDPTSTSSLRTVGDWRSDSAAWTGEFAGKIQYHSSIWYFQAATAFQFRNSGGSQVGYIDSSGNATFSGNVTAYSDSRLKENVVTVDNALDKATALRGVYYNKIGDPKRRVGVIAQEIQEVLPEVVLTVTEKNPATGEDSEMLAVDYGNIVGLLIEAVKELRAEVEKLKGGQ